MLRLRRRVVSGASRPDPAGPAGNTRGRREADATEAPPAPEAAEAPRRRSIRRWPISCARRPTASAAPARPRPRAGARRSQMPRPTRPARCGGSPNRPPRHAASPATGTAATGPGAGPAPHRDLFPGYRGRVSLVAHGRCGPRLARARVRRGHAARKAGAGFRTGFWLAVSGCALALGTYLMADEIAEIVPAAEAPLDRYVRAVDTGRTVLADTVERLLAQL